LLRELDGIGQKVNEDLRVPARIAENMLEHSAVLVAAVGHLELNAFLRDQVVEHADTLVKDLEEVEELVVYSESIFLHLGQIEQVEH
jgi:hypothetical protein